MSMVVNRYAGLRNNRLDNDKIVESDQLLGDRDFWAEKLHLSIN